MQGDGSGNLLRIDSHGLSIGDGSAKEVDGLDALRDDWVGHEEFVQSAQCGVFQHRFALAHVGVNVHAADVQETRFQLEQAALGHLHVVAADESRTVGGDFGAALHALSG